jgi:Fe2+ or Zn2+ uptake regulation protein
VVDFDCPLNEMIKKVKRDKGFIVTKAEVFLEGYCSECSRENEGDGTKKR